MKLSRVFKLIICMIGFNQYIYIYAFRIKNTLKYDVKWTRSTAEGHHYKRENNILRPGETSNNILAADSNYLAPATISFKPAGNVKGHRVELRAVDSQQALASADIIFDVIEGTVLGYDEKYNSVPVTAIILDLPKPAPAPEAPPAPRPEDRPQAELKEQKEGKASDAAACATAMEVDMPAAPGGPRGMTAGATPQD